MNDVIKMPMFFLQIITGSTPSVILEAVLIEWLSPLYIGVDVLRLVMEVMKVSDWEGFLSVLYEHLITFRRVGTEIS